MSHYQKYIDCEFGYTQPSSGRNVLLTYTGTTDGFGCECEHCGKKLKTAHSFNGAEYGEEWLFGSECVKHVFGARLVKL